MRKQALVILSILFSAFAFAQEVKVTHNLPSSGSAGETINAEFTVTKGSIGAFAKFQCDVPSGTTVAAGDTKSGNFTFENNRVKIVWVSLPGDATFTFSVKITLASGASGAQNFTSQFYYLENNVKKEFAVPAHTINTGGGAATTTTSTPTTTPTETVATTTTSTPTTTPTETVATTTTPTVATTPTTTTSAPRNITFYVQIAALSTDPGLMYKKYGKMKVVIENGMYKVLIGTYSTIEEARKRKADLIGQGLVGSFVVGYENGVRVKL